MSLYGKRTLALVSFPFALKKKNTWTKAVCKEKGFILACSSRYNKHIAAEGAQSSWWRAAMIESREVVVMDFLFL